MDFVYQWIDVAWLPLALLMVHKPHRWLTLGFMLSSMLMMRLLVELMESTGYAYGFMPVLMSHVRTRALIVYSVFYVFFMIIAYYSPGSSKIVFLAASISIFIMTGVVATLIMVL